MNTLKKSFSYLVILFFGVCISIMTFRANIAADDAQFIYGITSGGLSDWYQSFLNYVPGRNLHIAWQALIFTQIPASVNTFGAFHIVQSISHSLIFAVMFTILIKLGLRRILALFIVVLAMLFPLFTSVVLWANALPQHIFSSLLLLLGLWLIQKSSITQDVNLPWGISIWAIVLFTLSLFTYDQSGSAVILILVLCVLLNFFPNAQNFLPIRTSKILMGGLLVSVIIYFIVFFEGRGTGNNLTFGSGTLARLVGNLFLPFKFLGKIKSDSVNGYSYFHFNPYISITLLALLVVIIASITCWLIYSKLEIHKHISRELSKFFFFMLLAMAAYFPAAVWYVSPRHLFLPGLFSFLALGIIVNLLVEQLPKSRKISSFQYMSGLLSLSLCLVGFNGQISDWVDRDKTRQKLYSALGADLAAIGEPCIVLGRELNSSDPYLYSENLNYAMDYYKGISIGSVSHCNVPPVEGEPFEFTCADGNSEKWVQLRGYTYSKENGTFSSFKLSEVC
jgi:hypothetical protein